MRHIVLLALSILFVGCSGLRYSATFPAADDVFITTGDGDIQKPYTPIGHIIFTEKGANIPLPLLSLIPIKEVDPDLFLRQEVKNRVREMGGDALINLDLKYEPPTTYLYLFRIPGSIQVTGTVIKR